MGLSKQTNKNKHEAMNVLYLKNFYNCPAFTVIAEMFNRNENSKDFNLKEKERY